MSTPTEQITESTPESIKRNAKILVRYSNKTHREALDVIASKKYGYESYDALIADWKSRFSNDEDKDEGDDNVSTTDG